MNTGYGQLPLYVCPQTKPAFSLDPGTKVSAVSSVSFQIFCSSARPAGVSEYGKGLLYVRYECAGMIRDNVRKDLRVCDKCPVTIQPRSGSCIHNTARAFLRCPPTQIDKRPDERHPLGLSIRPEAGANLPWTYSVDDDTTGIHPRGHRMPKRLHR